MLELASRVWQLAFPNNSEIFNFAKLFCVLIIPEVKNNDSNDTLDEKYIKLKHSKNIFHNQMCKILNKYKYHPHKYDRKLIIRTPKAIVEDFFLALMKNEFYS